jgi:hypothetical protein
VFIGTKIHLGNFLQVQGYTFTYLRGLYMNAIQSPPQQLASLLAASTQANEKVEDPNAQKAINNLGRAVAQIANATVGQSPDAISLVSDVKGDVFNYSSSTGLRQVP